jgi:hypothetical protein
VVLSSLSLLVKSCVTSMLMLLPPEKVFRSSDERPRIVIE